LRFLIKRLAQNHFNVMSTKQLFIVCITLIIVSFISGIVVDRQYGPALLNATLGKIIPQKYLSAIDAQQTNDNGAITQKLVDEESNVIDVVQKASPSVVTVNIKKTQQVITNPFGGLFDPFGFFGRGQNQQPQVQQQNIQQDIGTGFVVSSEGLIVTNKHVVSDNNADYQVFSTSNKEYKVTNIYRDPTLDLAILKVDGLDIKPLPLGDSSNLKAGQSVIAIGTALGEFRNTVTTGVVSGLGRGITAGDQMGYSTEQLDNVIQTDAAINPGNSGGPLLNSAGQVIGVNVATAGNAENISFAIPINVIKEALDNFDKTGRFDRAFLGVQYKMISRELSVMNEIPEGAYIVVIVDNSPASKAGLQKGDIIQKMDGKAVTDTDGGLAKLISQHKIGDRVSVDYWRDGKTQSTTVTLGQSSQ